MTLNCASPMQLRVPALVNRNQPPPRAFWHTEVSMITRVCVRPMSTAWTEKEFHARA